MRPMERQYHIDLAPGEVGRYCILPGDPGRCEAIARFFDSPAHLTQNREFNTWTGLLDGERKVGGELVREGKGAKSHQGAEAHPQKHRNSGGRLTREEETRLAKQGGKQ